MIHINHRDFEKISGAGFNLFLSHIVGPIEDRILRNRARSIIKDRVTSGTKAEIEGRLGGRDNVDNSIYIGPRLKKRRS